MKMPKYFHVLYAEDNEDACVMVTTMLKFSNIKVTTVSTIREAWNLAQTNHFDLYLLDSQFPDGDGLDLCRTLREHCRHTPIIFYSGNAYQSDREKGLAAGANDYLTKPYFEDLAVTVRKTIEKTVNPTRKAVTTTVEAQLRMTRTDQINYF